MKGQAKVIVVSRRVEPRYWMAPKFKYYEIMEIKTLWIFEKSAFVIKHICTNK